MPGKSDGVTDPFGINLKSCSIRIQTRDRSENRIFFFTHIAGCAYGNIQFVIGTKRNKFPSVMGFVRILVKYNYGLRRLLQMVLNIIITGNAADLCYIKASIAEGN